MGMSVSKCVGVFVSMNACFCVYVLVSEPV